MNGGCAVLVKRCIAVLLFAGGLASISAAEDKAVKIAIIKADDVRRVTDNWSRFFELSAKKGVKVSAGIVCSSLAEDSKGYYKWLLGLQEAGQVEFWNHGWDHKRWEKDGAAVQEFKGSGYEHQKKHFEDSQEIMKRVLGKAAAAFGSPFNGMDGDTVKVMDENPDVRLLFSHSAQEVKGKVVAPMKLTGEADGVGKPNAEKFKTDYIKREGVEFSAIQFHPNAFSEKEFDEYAKIIDFLKEEGWVFMLPSEYLAGIMAKDGAGQGAANE